MEYGLNELLGRESRSIENKKMIALQYSLSTEHALEVFRTWFGPTLRTMKIPDKDKQQNLPEDLKGTVLLNSCSQDPQ